MIKNSRLKKKVWLNRYRRLLDEIESLENLERERYSSLVDPSAKIIDDMPKPPQPSNNRDIGIIKHLEVKEELILLKKQATIVRHEISSVIRCLPINQAKVLRYRYINGFDWAQIQILMDYSIGGVFNLHRHALDNVELPEALISND